MQQQLLRTHFEHIYCFLTADLLASDEGIEFPLTKLANTAHLPHLAGKARINMMQNAQQIIGSRCKRPENVWTYTLPFLLWAMVQFQTAFAQNLYLGAQGGLYRADLPRTFSNHFDENKIQPYQDLVGGFNLEMQLKNRWVFGFSYLKYAHSVSFYTPSASPLYSFAHNVFDIWPNEFLFSGGRKMFLGESNFSILTSGGLSLITGIGQSQQIRNGVSDSIRFYSYAVTTGRSIIPAVHLALRGNLEFSNGMFLSAGFQYMTTITPAGTVDVEISDLSGNILVKTKADVFPRGLRFLVGLHYPISRIWRGKPEQP